MGSQQNLRQIGSINHIKGKNQIHNMQYDWFDQRQNSRLKNYVSVLYRGVKAETFHWIIIMIRQTLLAPLSQQNPRFNAIDNKETPFGLDCLWAKLYTLGNKPSFKMEVSQAWDRWAHSNSVKAINRPAANLPKWNGLSESAKKDGKQDVCAMFWWEGMGDWEMRMGCPDSKMVADCPAMSFVLVCCL